jgi:hypothetical protein
VEFLVDKLTLEESSDEEVPPEGRRIRGKKKEAAKLLNTKN